MGLSQFQTTLLPKEATTLPPPPLVLALVISWQHNESDQPVSANWRWSMQKVKGNSTFFVNSLWNNFGLKSQQLNQSFSALLCLSPLAATSTCLCGCMVSWTGELIHLNNSPEKIKEERLLFGRWIFSNPGYKTGTETRAGIPRRQGKEELPGHKERGGINKWIEQQPFKPGLPQRKSFDWLHLYKKAWKGKRILMYKTATTYYSKIFKMDYKYRAQQMSPFPTGTNCFSPKCLWLGLVVIFI